MPQPTPRWVRLAAWFHRRCLALAPRRFRQDFGDDTDRAFVRLVTETRAARGTGAACVAALSATADTVQSGLADRLGDAGRAVTSGLWLDVTRAPRVYWRAPVIAGAITIILAVAGGPVVAISAALYQGILAPLPYRDAGRLVVVTHASAQGRNFYLRGWSVGDYRRVGAFEQVSGVRPLGNRVTFGDDIRQVFTYQMTAGTLDMLGATLAAGRDLRLDDGDDAVVVSRGFAQRHFGTADSAIGKTITLARGNPTIVGVLDRQPSFPGPPMAPDLFVPHPSADRPEFSRQDRRTQAIVIARLRDGVSFEQAEAETRAVAAAIHTEFGGDAPDARLESLRTATAGPLLVPMLLLLGAVFVFFLIAVSSLASLVIARTASRVGDMALRRSLGASRWRLIRGWTVDGLVLALPGALIGAWLANALLALARTQLPLGMIPGVETVGRLELSSAAMVLLLLTTLLFAAAPALAGVLNASGTSSTHLARIAGLRRLRTQSLLVASQVATSVLLVASALWLALGLYRTLSRPVGFDPDGLATVIVDSPRQSTREPEVVARAREAFDARFGPANVTVASSIPGMNTSGFVPLRVRPDQDVLAETQRPRLVEFSVAGNYFSMMGIPILEGRAFTPEEERGEVGAIILSRTFASLWFPDGAIGQTVSFSRTDGRTVVGVVADVHSDTVANDATNPAFYTPLAPPGLATISTFVIRTTRTIRDIDTEARAIFRNIDPSATLFVQSARDAMGLRLAPRRLAQNAVIGLALLALALAIVNIYALSAYSVLQRSREIGIRIALGATTSDALRLVMRRGLTWITCGLAAGTAAAFALARPALRAQIASLPTDEHWLLVVASTAVCIVAIVAAWLPARRAARIDPAVTLRAE